MTRIEPIDNELFTTRTAAQGGEATGGEIPVTDPSAHPSYERYADYGPNGEFIGWGYVQVD